MEILIELFWTAPMFFSLLLVVGIPLCFLCFFLNYLITPSKTKMRDMIQEEASRIELALNESRNL